MSNISRTRHVKTVYGNMALCLAMILLISPVASAQPGSATAESSTSNVLEEVQVTGTRLKQDGTRTPTPVAMISNEDLEIAAKINVADYINGLPQLQGSSTPRSVGFTSSADSQGANRLNLRNLGSERTLVLLDGRRVVPSVSNGSVDINLMPNALVSRIDIVTGGASAAYGADAVAGVVNLVLDKKYEGVKIDFQGGSSSESDAESIAGSIAAGTAFADGRGHIVAAIDYADNDSASLADRDWARGVGIVPNPDFAPGNGEAEFIRANVGSGLATPGGLFFAGPPGLANTTFDDAGNPIPWERGPLGVGFNAISPDAYDLIPLQQITTEIERYSAFTHLGYDISDNLSVYGEIMYAESENNQQTLPLFRLGGSLLVQADNGYLDPATAQQFANFGVDALPLGKFALNLGFLQPTNSREVQRYLVGIDGTFGNDWSWGTYYQYGEVDNKIQINNNVIESRFNMAADAVDDGMGNIVCRSTLTDPGNGCLPYNVFGNQPVDPALLDYITGTIVQNQNFTQHVWSVSATGPLVDLWAGPLIVAVGADYRDEESEADADVLSQQNGWFVGNYEPFAGEVDVKEIYLEVGLPLATDSSIGNLDFNAAVRSTDYSNSGSVNTWKYGLVFAPTDELLFRYTQSRDIRAPNVNDLFSQGRFNTLAVSDPFNGGVDDQVLQRRAGNPSLEPEEADTFTVGVVYVPEWAPELSFSIDYFDIELEGEIASSSIQTILDNCFAGDQEACGFVVRDNTGDIIQIDNVAFNASESRVAGLDLEVNYSMDLGPGTLRMRGFASYIDKLSRGKPGTSDFISRKGEVGNNAGRAGDDGAGSPDWQGVVNIAYLTSGGTTIAGSVRHIDSAVIESDFSSSDLLGNNVHSRTYLDLNISHEIETSSGNYQIFANVDNVFDRDPPIVPSLQGTAAFDTPTNPRIYDTLGRMFRIGVRMEF